MAIPFRFTLAFCGFWTTFAALLARNAITIAIVQLAAPPPSQNGSGSHNYCDDGVNLSYAFNETPDDAKSESVWTHQQRAMMLGAFFLGHTFGFVIVGPVLSKLGVRHSITFVLLSSSIMSMLFPTFLSVSFGVAFASRLLLGIIQAIHMPAFLMLWGSWAPG